MRRMMRSPGWIGSGLFSKPMSTRRPSGRRRCISHGIDRIARAEDHIGAPCRSKILAIADNSVSAQFADQFVLIRPAAAETPAFVAYSYRLPVRLAKTERAGSSMRRRPAGRSVYHFQVAIWKRRWSINGERSAYNATAEVFRDSWAIANRERRSLSPKLARPLNAGRFARFNASCSNSSANTARFTSDIPRCTDSPLFPIVVLNINSSHIALRFLFDLPARGTLPCHSNRTDASRYGYSLVS
jgi:hypothetical protein